VIAQRKSVPTLSLGAEPGDGADLLAADDDRTRRPRDEAEVARVVEVPVAHQDHLRLERGQVLAGQRQVALDGADDLPGVEQQQVPADRHHERRDSRPVQGDVLGVVPAVAEQPVARGAGVRGRRGRRQGREGRERLARLGLRRRSRQHSQQDRQAGEDEQTAQHRGVVRDCAADSCCGVPGYARRVPTRRSCSILTSCPRSA
jgi:hypothetical protein